MICKSLLNLATESYRFLTYSPILSINSILFNQVNCVRNIKISNCILRKSSLLNVKTNTEKKALKNNNVQELSKNIGIWKNPINGDKLDKGRESFNKYIRMLGKVCSDKNLSNDIPCEVNLKYYDTILRCQDKIFELAVLLKCSPEEAFSAILKHHFLFHSRIPTLKDKVDLLTEGGILLEDLRKDLWVLSYTNEKLKARIEKIKALKLPIKCWMLRCKETVLDRTWVHREENKAALLPFRNSREYLCSRLDMNSNQLIAFTIRHPAVLKVKTAKLREVLDYLLTEGFTRTQIYSTPRILCHSITTIKNRLNKLRTRDFEPHTLSLLCMSAKAFQLYLEKLDDKSTETETET